MIDNIFSTSDYCQKLVSSEEEILNANKKQGAYLSQNLVSYHAQGPYSLLLGNVIKIGEPDVRQIKEPGNFQSVVVICLIPLKWL